MATTIYVNSTWTNEAAFNADTTKPEGLVWGKTAFSNYQGAYNYASVNDSSATIIIESTNTLSGNTFDNNHKNKSKLAVVIKDGASLGDALSKWDMTYAVTVEAGGKIEMARPKSASVSNIHIKNTLTIGEAGEGKKTAYLDLLSDSYQDGDISLRYNGKIVANNAVIDVQDLDAQGKMTLTNTTLNVDGALATTSSVFYKNVFTNCTINVAGTQITGGLSDFSGGDSNQLGSLDIIDTTITFKAGAAVKVAGDVTMTGTSTLDVDALTINKNKKITMDSSSKLTVGSLAGDGTIIVNLVEGFNNGDVVVYFKNNDATAEDLAKISFKTADGKNYTAMLNNGDIVCSEVFIPENNVLDLSDSTAGSEDQIIKAESITTGDSTEPLQLKAQVIGDDISLENNKKLSITGSVDAYGDIEITNAASSVLDGGDDDTGAKITASGTITMNNDGHAVVDMDAKNIIIANNSVNTLKGTIGSEDTESIVITADEIEVDGVVTSGQGGIEDATITAKQINIADQVVTGNTTAKGWLLIDGDTAFGNDDDAADTVTTTGKTTKIVNGATLTVEKDAVFNSNGQYLIAGDAIYGADFLDFGADQENAGGNLVINGTVNATQTNATANGTIVVNEGAVLKSGEICIEDGNITDGAKGKLNVIGTVNTANLRVFNGGTVDVSGTVNADQTDYPIGTTGYAVLDVWGAGSTVNINGGTVNIKDDARIQSGAALNINGGTLNVDYTLTNAGTFTVSGESTLNISKVAAGSNDIELSEGAILKDSTIMGDVGVTGNVIFRGKNVLNNIYDFGEYDAYGSGNWAKWTVEAGSQLFLEQTVTGLGNNLYGVGYGDTVVINGNLTDAAAAREAGLTKDDASFYSKTGVRFSSAAGYATSSFTVNNAYVILGTEGSFSNSAKNGGSHNITFNTAVVDAAQFFFSDSTATFDLKINDSDVNVVIFMTGDKNSVYSLTNSKVVTTGSGNDRYNGNDGALTITNSEITIKQGSYKNTGTITIDETSKLIVPTLENTGTITVDVSDNWKGVATVIDAADGTADFGKIELADEGLTTRIDEANGDLIVYNVDTDKLYVNSAWSDGVWGKEVADGKYFGINAFASLDSALKAGITYGGAAIEMLDETVATENLQQIVTKMTGASGMDFSITGNSAGNEFIAIEMRNAGDPEDFTELATLTIKDANLNSYKIAAYQNSKITIENSTIDFHGDQNGPLYTKGNGEIYVKDSVIDNTVQISAMGAVMEFDNSTLNSGSAAQISSVMTFKNGSTYTLSSAKIYGGSGSLTLDGSTMVRKAARTAQDIANSLVYFVNGAANIPTALAKYAYSVFVGGSQYSTTAHTGTGTMTVTNSTFDISKAYADANYADVEGYENSEGLVGVGIGSTLTISNSIFNTDVLMNEGTITIDATSLLTAGSINNEGTITIDATGYTGDAVKIIDLDQEGRLYNVELKGGEGYVLRYESDGDVVLTKAPETGTLYVNSAWAGSENGDGVGDGLIYGLNAFADLESAAAFAETNPAATTLTIFGGSYYAPFKDVILSGGITSVVADGLVSADKKSSLVFKADEAGEYTVSGEYQTTGTQGYLWENGQNLGWVTAGIVRFQGAEGVVFKVTDAAFTSSSAIQFIGGKTVIDADSTFSAAEDKETSVAIYGEVVNYGKINLVTTANPGTALLIGHDSYASNANKLTVSGSDASVVIDTNANVDTNIHASGTLIVEDGASVDLGTLTNNGTIKVSGESNIKANVTGDGWIYMNNVTLDKDTTLTGAKIRFAGGNNVIDGATVNTKDAAGVFEVGARTSTPDENVDYENPITVTVKNSTIASGYGGQCAYVGENNTLAVENSLTYFKQINSYGNFSITGDTAGDKYTWGRSAEGLTHIEYSTYIGTFNIFDGEATLKNTSFHALNGAIYGSLTVDGANAYFTGQAAANVGLHVKEGGELSIENKSVVYYNNFDNAGTIILDGQDTKVILTGSKAHENKKDIQILNDAAMTDEGSVPSTINNGGTITVDGGNLSVATVSNGAYIEVTGLTAGAAREITVSLVPEGETTGTTVTISVAQNATSAKLWNTSLADGVYNVTVIDGTSVTAGAQLTIEKGTFDVVAGESTINVGTLVGEINVAEGAALTDSSIKGGVVKLHGATVTDSTLDVVYVYGENSWTGTNTINQLSLGWYNSGANIVGNITGTANVTNFMIGNIEGFTSTLNIGDANGERTTINGHQHNYTTNSVVNVTNADVTGNYASMTGVVTVTDSTYSKFGDFRVVAGSNHTIAPGATFVRSSINGSYGYVGGWSADATGYGVLTLNDNSTWKSSFDSITTERSTVTMDASDFIAGRTFTHYGTLNMDEESSINAAALTFGENGVINITIDTADLTESIYNLINITGNGDLDTAKVNITIGETTDTLANLMGKDTVKQLGEDYYLVQSDNDLAIFNANPDTIYVNSAYAGKELYDVVNGNVVGINAFSSFREAVGAAVKLGGATIDLTDEKYVYADALNSDANMLVIDKAGTYTITGGEGLLVNYELEINPEKEDADYIVNWDKANVTMCKLTFRDSVTAAIKDSTMNFKGFLGNGTMSGPSYLSVYRDSTLSVENSTVGLDISRDDGKFDDDAIYHNFGATWTVYGSLTVTGSTIYAGCAWGNDSFVIHTGAAATITDSIAHVVHLNVGYAGDEEKKLNPNRTSDDASLVLDNTKVYNTMYQGDGGLVHSGLLVGSSSNSNTNTVTVKNNSVIDMTVNGSVVGSPSDKGLYVGNSNSSVKIESGSKVIVNTGSNSGSVKIDNASLEVTGTFTNTGVFSADGATLNVGTFTHNGTSSVILNNVDLDVTNFVNNVKDAGHYAVIGGTSKVQIDNLSGDRLHFADGTVLKDGTSIKGTTSTRSLGDITFGETENDVIHVDSFANNGTSAYDGTITVNGTLTISEDVESKESSTYWLGINGSESGTILTSDTGNGVINSYGYWNIFQYGSITLEEGVTVNVLDAKSRDLRFTLTDMTIKGQIHQIGSNNKLTALQSANVTITGENAALTVDDYLMVGYSTYKYSNDDSVNYKSSIVVEDGANMEVGGRVFVNLASTITVTDATFIAGSVQFAGNDDNMNRGVFTVGGTSTVKIANGFNNDIFFDEAGAALTDDSSITVGGNAKAYGDLSFYWNDLSTADGKYLMVDGDLAINGVEMPSGDEVVFAYAGGVSVVGDISINGSTVVDNTIVVGGVKYDVVNDFDNGISVSVSDVQEVIPVSFTVNSITQGESDYSFTFDITADGGNGDYIYNVIAKDAYGNVISGTFADGVFTFADPAKSTPASFTVTVSDTYGASTAVSQTIVKDVNDITAPVWVGEVTDTVITGENGLYNVVDVHFEATDNFAVVGFIVTVNGEEFALLGTEHDYFYSTDVTGTYTYTVTAFDAAGNTITTEEKNVDLYAGMKYDFSGITQSDDNLYNFTVNADVTNGFGDYTYVITSVKNAAGEDVAFTANGLNFTLGELPPELKDETLTVTVKVTDAKQNEITFEGTATVVDKDAPVITVDPIDEAFTNKDVVVKASIADNFGAENVTFQYKIGNGEWTAYNAETGVVMTANGEITFKATDKAGNVTEEIVNINTIDKDAPVVEITGNADAWTNENVTLNVAVGEDVSTITAIEYQIGEDGEWLAVTDGQIVVEANATVNVKVTDGAGNITEQTIIVDKIDKDAPAVEISGNADVWTKENVTLTVAVGEDVSGTTIEYQIGEDGEWLVSTDGQIVVESNATVNVKVTDGAGNIVTDTIIVDKIDKDDPVVEISGNADVWTKENVTLSVAVAEDPSGTTIEYQIGEDGEWLVSTDGQIVVESNATVNVKVTDGAGNTFADTIIVDKIDKDAPAVEITGNADAWTNKNVTLTVAVGEDVSTITAIEYQIGEDGEWLAVTDGQIVVEANATVNVKVTDGAGNDTIQTIVVDKIDKDAPAIEVSGNAADWTSENVTLSVAVAEDPSGTTIEYQIGENGEWLVSTDGQIVVESNATVNVKVTDGAGNKTTDTIVVDKIDKAAPNIIVEADPTEVTNSDVIVTIAASDDVSGIASTKYSFNGTDWFDYTDAIVVKENTVIYIEVTDNAGKVAKEVINVSNIDKVAPDAPVASADITELTNETVTVTATFADDVVVKEYSLNGTDWFAYTDGVEMRENGTVYFRGYDAAGNVSSTSEYTVSNIDTTSDNADTVYVFINSGYTAENTVGKSVNGIELVYGENAFASIDDAQNELTDLDNVKFVLVENKTSLSGADDLTGVEAITSVTSTTTVKEGSYKSSINSKGTIAISGADAADTDIHNFKNVSVNMNAVVDSIDGGKATTTETEKSKVAANGTVTVSGSYKFSDAPTGKITIANATVNEVVNYSTINIDMDANVGHVRNESITIADSFKNSTATGKVERSVTLSSTNKAVGTINVAGKSTVVDSVEGFATVNVTDSNVGDIVRSINGAPCGSAKEVLKVTTGKDGVVTATLEESFSATRSGKLTVRSVDNKASVGAVSGYNTVTLDGGNADSIANDALAKRSAKYQQSWENADAYGSFSDYELNFDITSATLISSLEQYSASGSVTLKNGASAGDIANYSKVTATGSGVIGDITALDVEGIETVAGAIKKQTNVDLKKNTVTETETISSGASVKLDGYTAGSISGYKSVTLKNAAVESVDFGVAGSVKTVTTYDAEGNEVESTVTKSFTRNGSLTATDATVNGNISNYNTVKLIGTAVSGDIVNSTIAKELSSTVNGEETIVPTEKLSGTVTLTDTSVAGTIKDYSAVTFKGGEVESVSNVAKVTVSSGDNTIGSFTGTAEADSFTVAKGATMVLGSADFGNGKDKLTVSGTLILTSAAISNLETITGKGEIAAAADIFADVEALVGTDFNGTLVNLGATAEGFRGTAFELADNVEKKAVAWDAAEAFTGWIGSSEGCTDNVDFITFTADEDGMLSIGGEFDSITLNGNAIDLATVSGGIALEAGMEYTLKLERNSDSISYTLALA